VGRGADTPGTSSPSIEVCIEVVDARPTAEANGRAELRIAPMVPAADDGVEAEIAILKGDIRTVIEPR